MKLSLCVQRNLVKRLLKEDGCIFDMHVEHLSINLFVVHPSSLRKCFTKSLWLKRDNIIFPGGKPIFPPGIQHYLNKIDKSIFPGGNIYIPPGDMHLSIKSLEETRTFKGCFRTEEPVQTCGPELKTKLGDSFELFSAS